MHRQFECILKRALLCLLFFFLLYLASLIPAKETYCGVEAPYNGFSLEMSRSFLMGVLSSVPQTLALVSQLALVLSCVEQLLTMHHQPIQHQVMSRSENWNKTHRLLAQVTEMSDSCYHPHSVFVSSMGCYRMWCYLVSIKLSIAIT